MKKIDIDKMTDSKEREMPAIKKHKEFTGATIRFKNSDHIAVKVFCAESKMTLQELTITAISKYLQEHGLPPLNG